MHQLPRLYIKLNGISFCLIPSYFQQVNFKELVIPAKTPDPLRTYPSIQLETFPEKGEL